MSLEELLEEHEVDLVRGKIKPWWSGRQFVVRFPNGQSEAFDKLDNALEAFLRDYE
jgi:hypothetical protein